MASFELLPFPSAIVLLSSLFFQTRCAQLRARQRAGARIANSRLSSQMPWVHRPLKRQPRTLLSAPCTEKQGKHRANHMDRNPR